MPTYTQPDRATGVVAPGAGTHPHFLNHLATVKVAAGTDGAMSVVEFTAPRGFGPPLHRHRDEDELFVILEGTLSLRAGSNQLVTRVPTSEPTLPEPGYIDAPHVADICQAHGIEVRAHRPGRSTEPATTCAKGALP